VSERDIGEFYPSTAQHKEHYTSIAVRNGESIHTSRYVITMQGEIETVSKNK
jgi:hypothetical protein